MAIDPSVLIYQRRGEIIKVSWAMFTDNTENKALYIWEGKINRRVLKDICDFLRIGQACSVNQALLASFFSLSVCGLDYASVLCKHA